MQIKKKTAEMPRYQNVKLHKVFNINYVFLIWYLQAKQILYTFPADEKTQEGGMKIPVQMYNITKLIEIFA